MKIKLTISYDGSGYYGSQIQPNYKTVQSALEDSFKVLNISTKCEFSGRTDRYVHAFAQVVSCDIPEYWSNISKLKQTLNKLLPNDILVRKIVKVSDDFHARFSAKSREYRYIFTDKPLTPFTSKYISYYKDIDIKLINQAIECFVGVWDFEYFSKKGSEPISTVREIYSIKFYRYKDIYVLRFKANSYLRSQIRMMVDFIMKISAKKLTIDDLEKQLKKQQLISWSLASPHGLYLSKILYL